MRTTLLNRGLAAVAITAIALLGMTACTGTPISSSNGSTSSSESAPPAEESGSGQTVAEACALIEDTMNQAMQEYENMSVEDPAALIAAMDAAVQSLSDASAQVTNEEVGALMPSLQEMFQTLADAFTALADGDMSKLTELEGVTAEFQQTATRFQELCAP
ncbi:hypothetical protein [Microbacterium sp. CPCC 204701]|uniref:hypothetical protein n=1 Tax=Microbacterium sp. CPCC 204701 TaxID=2493084 RepID=UPI000FD7F3FE|nr:hypothetical protein [Microbacterium sp. CPCC 204701]